MDHRSVPDSGRPDDQMVGKKLDRTQLLQLVQELVQLEPAARLLQAPAADGRPGDLCDVGGLLAHELRQPLFTIAMANENLRLILESEEFDREVVRRSVMRISEQVEHAQAIIQHTLLDASRRANACDTGDIVASVAYAAHLLETLQDAHDVQIVWRLPPAGLLVAASRLELDQVFCNLLRNAIESIDDRRKAGWDGRGRIVVTIERCGDDVRATIADNGAGLSPSAEKFVFKPFYTTKADDGTGLGLHLCRQLIGKAQGIIALKAGNVEGAEVEMVMPLVRPPSHA
jgi:two-component system C4-dicarboxylate transport sensor histidine kinase DctB/two-component system sensor histidine kinase TtrS